MTDTPRPGHDLWRFAVDRGGTFTDVIALDPAGVCQAGKLLSQSRAYEDAAIEGIRRFLVVPHSDLTFSMPLILHCLILVSIVTMT